MDLNSYISWLQSEEEIDASVVANFYSFADNIITRGLADSVILGETESEGEKKAYLNYPDSLDIQKAYGLNPVTQHWSQLSHIDDFGGYFTFRMDYSGFFALLLYIQYPDYIDASWNDDTWFLYPYAPSVQPLATPTGLTADQITSTGARIGWNAVTNASSYKVEYRRQGDTTWNE